MSKRASWMIALAVVALPLVGPGYCAFVIVGDGVANRRALAFVRDHCDAHGPIRVLNRALWQEASSKTQADRLANPGRFDVPIRDHRIEPHPRIERVTHSTGLGTYRGRPVIALDNYQYWPENIFSRAGLTGNGPSFDCLTSTPSPARSVILGW